MQRSPDVIDFQNPDEIDRYLAERRAEDDWMEYLRDEERLAAQEMRKTALEELNRRRP